MNTLDSINYALEDYLERLRYSYYIKHLKDTMYLLNLTKETYQTPSIIKEDSTIMDYHQTIAASTTITLVREFLQTLKSNYLTTFDESLKDGTFGAVIANYEKPSIPLNCSGTQNNHPFYHVKFNQNISDGAIIIHEFFHYTNHKPKTTYVRAHFTEFISIFMENIYLDFLTSKGYDQKEIAKVRYNRYLEFGKDYRLLYDETMLLYAKDILGSINNQNYQFVKEYQSHLMFPQNYQKEDYQTLLNRLTKRINVFDEESWYKNFTPWTVYHYYIGTLFCSYLLENKQKEENQKRVLALNELLASDDLETFNQSYQILGLNPLIEETNSEIDSPKEELYTTMVLKNNTYYQKSFNEINSKSKIKKKIEP